MAYHSSNHAHAGEHNPIAHVMPKSMLLGVFALLVGLTLLTVWQGTTLHLGALEIVLSLTIATMKAGLVVFFFMHLKYDKPLNAMAFFFSLLFVALFIGLTLVDARSYHPDVEAYEAKSAANAVSN